MDEQEPTGPDYRGRGYRLGLKFGRLARMLGLGRLLGPLFHALWRLRDRRLREAFEREYDDARVVGFLLLSEPHQRVHFFGEDGLLSPYSHRIAISDWREAFKRQEDETWEQRGKTFRGLVAKRWRLSNLRRDLPFGLVLADDSTFRAFRFNENYRKRLRDPEPLEVQERLFLDLLVRSRRAQATGR